MAYDANTWETYDGRSSGIIRESLADFITNIAPTEVPFQSNMPSGSVDSTFYEWTKDTLDTAADSAALEGAEAVNVAITPTTRLNNYTQISTKTVSVTGSDMKANNAGMADRMAYEIVKKGQEMKRDNEVTLVASNKGKAAGSAGATAREVGNVHSWLVSNVDAAGDATPATGGGVDGHTDGTARAFTESMLTGIIDDIFLAGGNPTILMTNTKQKRVITETFVGNSTVTNREAVDKSVINAVDVYVSDYGQLMIVPNRFMRQSDVFVFDKEMWEVVNYRDYQMWDLAKTGDSDSKQMLREFGLISKEEAASGAIYDLTA